MSAKETIFNRLRQKNSTPKISLPKMEIQATSYENPIEKFKEMLKSVGGSCLEIKQENLFSEINILFPNLRNLASHIPLPREKSIPEIDLTRIDDPHQLADLELMVAMGAFGVAENGAVWVDHPTHAHRVVYFIAEHLILAIHKKDILNNMHEAYQRISLTAWKDQNYGVFISGPSKTADIEQSLVIGAHGPKSMYVFLLED